MSTRSNKYIKPQDDVVVESDAEEKARAASATRIIISSYTVPPRELFVTCQNGRYDFYIDVGAKAARPSVSSDTFSENQAFEIALSDLDLDSDSEEDERGIHDALRVNDDYVQMDV